MEKDKLLVEKLTEYSRNEIVRESIALIPGGRLIIALLDKYINAKGIDMEYELTKLFEGYPEAEREQIITYILSMLDRVENDRMEDSIIAIGSGNLENLLICEETVSLGNKYSVTVKELWGGSAVNFSCRLLSEGIGVIPLLTIANDDSGNKIREAIVAAAIRGGVGSNSAKYLSEGNFFIKGTQKTPTSTILVHNGERTIFRQNLLVDNNFNKNLFEKVKKVTDEYGTSHISFMVGHIPTERDDLSDLCTERILEAIPSSALTYLVFGGKQLILGWDYWKKYIDKIDVFQCNINEAKSFFSNGNRATELSKAIEIIKQSKLTAILTMDRFGAIGIFNGEPNILLTGPLIRKDDVVDSTGAGDSFASGTISYLHKKGKKFTRENFITAMKQGSIWASSACMVYGGCGENPKKDLEYFINNKCDHLKCSVEDRKPYNVQEFIEFIDLAYQ
jgi:sugar/nucleoside kinase (ribokinase family)